MFGIVLVHIFAMQIFCMVKECARLGRKTFFILWHFEPKATLHNERINTMFSYVYAICYCTL